VREGVSCASPESSLDHRWKGQEDEACGGRAREMGSMGDRPLAPLDLTVEQVRWR